MQRRNVTSYWDACAVSTHDERVYAYAADAIGGSQRDSGAYLTDQGPGNQANQNYQAALQKVLDALIAAGDSLIIRLPIPASAVARAPGASQFGDNSGYGCGFHPNAATIQRPTLSRTSRSRSSPP